MTYDYFVICRFAQCSELSHKEPLVLTKLDRSVDPDALIQPLGLVMTTWSKDMYLVRSSDLDCDIFEAQ